MNDDELRAEYREWLLSASPEKQGSAVKRPQGLPVNLGTPSDPLMIGRDNVSLLYPTLAEILEVSVEETTAHVPEHVARRYQLEITPYSALVPYVSNTIGKHVACCVFHTKSNANDVGIFWATFL